MSPALPFLNDFVVDIVPVKITATNTIGVLLVCVIVVMDAANFAGTAVVVVVFDDVLLFADLVTQC